MISNWWKDNLFARPLLTSVLALLGVWVVFVLSAGLAWFIVRLT